MASGGTEATHLIIPVEIHYNASGSKAVSESVGSITVHFSQADVQFDCMSWARFVSKLQNVEGVGWRLCSLEAVYLRDSITPVVPGDTAKVEKEIHEMLRTGVGRETYKCLALVLQNGGFKVGDDMPGVDDPQSVKKCMEKVFEWIQ
jgi:hypothetical protein